ncbi:MAG: helix-turn-helix domain-containing protein, partial [Parascardovia denticolens]
MSVAAVDWALRRAPVGADASARLVLVYLADRADDEGRDAFLSIATLVEQSHLSRSTIKRILRRLEERGLISRGDQLKVAHYRIDRHPVVWDLHVELTVDDSREERGLKMTLVRNRMIPRFPRGFKMSPRSVRKCVRIVSEGSPVHGAGVHWWTTNHPLNHQLNL